MSLEKFLIIVYSLAILGLWKVVEIIHWIATHVTICTG